MVRSSFLLQICKIFCIFLEFVVIRIIHVSGDIIIAQVEGLRIVQENSQEKFKLRASSILVLMMPSHSCAWEGAKAVQSTLNLCTFASNFYVFVCLFVCRILEPVVIVVRISGDTSLPRCRFQEIVMELSHPKLRASSHLVFMMPHILVLEEETLFAEDHHFTFSRRNCQEKKGSGLSF